MHVTLLCFFFFPPVGWVFSVCVVLCAGCACAFDTVHPDSARWLAPARPPCCALYSAHPTARHTTCSYFLGIFGSKWRPDAGAEGKGNQISGGHADGPAAMSTPGIINVELYKEKKGKMQKKQNQMFKISIYRTGAITMIYAGKREKQKKHRKNKNKKKTRKIKSKHVYHCSLLDTLISSRPK